MIPPIDFPPWSSLVAFRAAAHRQSFKEAALELRQTPSAISHQIKRLENWVGGPLFDRRVRQVRLTPLGQKLAEGLDRGFGEVSSALGRARAGTETKMLRIAALPLFANGWLTHRLPAFEKRHPSLSIAIDTSASIADLLLGEADVAIRNLQTPTPGVWAKKLLDIRAVPLCIPDLAKQIQSADDFAGQTLIGLTVGRRGWLDWFAAFGVPEPTDARMLLFDSMTNAIDAAAQGRGVLLALTPLVWDIPASKGLVVPQQLAPQEAGSYYVVCRKEDRTNAAIGGFVDWLCLEMQRDLPRLRKVDSAARGKF
jgi:DNA-binding transcriptional LysR family regulator